MACQYLFEPLIENYSFCIKFSNTLASITNNDFLCCFSCWKDFIEKVNVVSQFRAYSRK